MNVLLIHFGTCVTTSARSLLCVRDFPTRVLSSVMRTVCVCVHPVAKHLNFIVNTNVTVREFNMNITEYTRTHRQIALTSQLVVKCNNTSPSSIGNNTTSSPAAPSRLPSRTLCPTRAPSAISNDFSGFRIFALSLSHFHARLFPPHARALVPTCTSPMAYLKPLRGKARAAVQLASNMIARSKTPSERYFRVGRYIFIPVRLVIVSRCL